MEKPPQKIRLWSYVFKNTTEDLRTGKNLPPALEEGSTTEFDPGEDSFGVWISNDGFTDGGVFSEPALVARINRRLASQPYKAMIYPYRDKTTGKDVPHSFLIGWEYSTNDDFQDVVCRIESDPGRGTRGPEKRLIALTDRRYGSKVRGTGIWTSLNQRASPYRTRIRETFSVGFRACLDRRTLTVPDTFYGGSGHSWLGGP